MKILIDIGHPAHVHYFKNFIIKMKDKGHDFMIIARDRSFILELLEKYNFEYYSRGSGSTTILGKIFYIHKADYRILKQSKLFNPDLLLSFGSPYLAHVSFLIRKPHIVFDDTECDRFQKLLCNPFSETLITPNCYSKELGKKQIRFNGYMELSYLHPNYFSPKKEILEQLKLQVNEKFVIVRFVAKNASHNIGVRGISNETKIKVVNEFLKFAKVYITSETQLPESLQPYQIRIPPEMMHDVISYASLLYGESATMASEAAMLGVPAIFVDKIGRGYTNELESTYELVNNFTISSKEQRLSIEKGIELIKTPNIKEMWNEKRKKMLNEKIDVTDFMIWFVHNYPDSVDIYKSNSEYKFM